jgi:lipopolysaccharide assembly protein A
MRFLIAIFWTAMVVALAIFASNNWVPVSVYLWNNEVMDTYLPIPLFAAFLLGFIPYFIAHRATRWSMGRKLAQAERAITETRMVPAPAVAPPQSSPITSGAAS